MSSDDPTMELPDDKPGYDTKPGVTAILERIAALEARLLSEIASLRTDIRRLDHKIELQNRTIGDLYADQRETQERVDKLEGKPS